MRARGRQPPAGALLGGVFYYGDGDALVGVDAATGESRHRYTYSGYTGLSGPVAAGGKIAMLARVRPEPVPYRQALFLLPPDLTTSERVLTTRSYVPTAGIAAGGDIVAVWGHEEVWAVDARTGRTVLPRRKLALSEEAVGVAGRTVLTSGGAKGRLNGYDVRTGRRAWSVDTASGGDVTPPTVDVEGGRVLTIGADIAIVDPARGRVTFRVRASGRRAAGPGTYGGGAATAAGHLVTYSLDGLTGYR